MVNKHMNRCSTLLIGKCKSKTQYRVVYMSTRIAKKKTKQKNPHQILARMWRNDLSSLLVGVQNVTTALENSLSSVHSVMSDSLRPHGLQHARSPCPSPNPGVY